jgi:hypothetical protein
MQGGLSRATFVNPIVLDYHITKRLDGLSHEHNR